MTDTLPPEMWVAGMTVICTDKKGFRYANHRLTHRRSEKWYGINLEFPDEPDHQLAGVGEGAFRPATYADLGREPVAGERAVCLIAGPDVSMGAVGIIDSVNSSGLWFLADHDDSAVWLRRYCTAPLAPAPETETPVTSLPNCRCATVPTDRICIAMVLGRIECPCRECEQARVLSDEWSANAALAEIYCPHGWRLRPSVWTGVGGDCPICKGRGR